MPQKYEHILPCHLSKRQRLLYDEFMSRTKTKETLASGSYMHIINILMQLRKVCNHPNLFAEPDCASPLVVSPLQYRFPSLIVRELEGDVRTGILRADVVHQDTVNLTFLNLCLLHDEINSNQFSTPSYSDAIEATTRRVRPPIGYMATHSVGLRPG